MSQVCICHVQYDKYSQDCFDEIDDDIDDDNEEIDDDDNDDDHRALGFSLPKRHLAPCVTSILIFLSV